MSLDSDLLLSFLARPRTLDEVARRFGISPSEAERLVMKAVESGQILISSLPSGERNTVAGPPVTGTGLASYSSKTTRSVRKRGLVQTGSSRAPLRANIRRGELLFKLRQDKPNTVHRMASHVQVSEILGGKTIARNNRQVSLPQQTRILEMLNSGPRSLDDLRAALGVSRDTLGRLVRRGLVRCDWGSKGIGNFYKITQPGLEELQRLRLASSIASGIARKELISLKTTAPQMAS